MMFFNPANCIVSTGFRSPFGSKIFLWFYAYYNRTSEAMVIDADKIEVLESKRSYLSGNSMLLDDLTGIDRRKSKKISCGLGRLSIGKEVSDITQFEFQGNDKFLDDCKNRKSSCGLRTGRAKDGDSESNRRHWMKTVIISCNTRIISEVNAESKREMSYLSGDHMLLDKNIDNDSKKNGDITRDFLLPNTHDSVSGTEGSGHSEKLLLHDDRRGIGSKKNQKNSCDWKTVSTTEAILHMEQTTEFPSNDDFISILLKCKKEKDFLGLNRMFALISDAVESNRNRCLGNYFVPAFVDCGRIACAVHVFEKLQYRNEYSWTSLIQAYIDQGETRHAFDLYDRMKQEFVHPNSFTFVALLTACVRSNMIYEGREIHCEIAMEGYETDRFIGSILVDLYAKCGFLEEAQDVFDTLLSRDVVVWTALIAGYVEHFLPEQALLCFERMQTDGVAPDAGTYVCILKACTSLGALIDGQRIQSEVIKKGYGTNAFVGNTLVDLYAKFAHVAEAEDTFDRLAFRDIISWNALIAGYSDCGHGEEVLGCLESMRGEVSPNAVTLSCSLKACGSLQCINKTREIHCELVKKGFENDGIVGNTLIDTYVKCNSLIEAHQSFDKLESRDLVAWNTILTAYGELAFGEDALNCFEEMKSAGVAPNHITFVCTLKALGSLEGAAKGGQALHIEIMKQGLETNTAVGNTLVDMYAKCGLLSESWKTFMGLSMHDVVTWNVVIAGYAERKLNEEVENCFKSMQLEGVFPDALTYIFVLKSCCEPGAQERGQKYHAEVVKDGFESNCHVISCLVVLYSRCGRIAEAQEVFNTMDTRDVVTWTALISGYAEYGSSREALNCFPRMCADGVSPNAFTYVSGLRACGKLGLVDRGQSFHSEIAKKGYERDAYVCSALVDAYCRCGSLDEARGLVDRSASRDVVSWTALIAGCADLGRRGEAQMRFEEMQRGGIDPDVVVWGSMISSCAEADCEKALRLYGQLQEQGVLPDSRVFVGALRACGEGAALEAGRKLHAVIGRIAASEAALANALVDMYGRCGSMADAQLAVDALAAWDLASWNALSTGYARQGDCDRVFELFQRMRAETNVAPDAVSFLNVLTACSHAGLVDAGTGVFAAMVRAYRISPSLKHQNCVVDLLGRAGRLEDAALMAERMPLEPDFVIWSTMLSACRKWGDVELGKRSFDSALNSGDSVAGAYILMVNIYSDARMWTDATRIEALRLSQRWIDASAEDVTREESVR